MCGANMCSSPTESVSFDSRNPLGVPVECQKCHRRYGSLEEGCMDLSDAGDGDHGPWICNRCWDFKFKAEQDAQSEIRDPQSVKHEDSESKSAPLSPNAPEWRPYAGGVRHNAAEFDHYPPRE